MKYVKRYFSILIPILKQYDSEKGGNLLFIQIENEYSDNIYCSEFYIEWLYNIAREIIGNDTIISILDDEINHSKYCTPSEAFVTYSTSVYDDIPNRCENSNPFMIGKLSINYNIIVNKKIFYVDINDVIKELKFYIDNSMPVIIRQLVGGTQYGLYMNNIHVTSSDYYVLATSYYDTALIRENGDTTYGYNVLRNFLLNYTGPLIDIPNNTTKKGYGKLEFHKSLYVFGSLSVFTKNVVYNTTALYFHELNTSDGYVLYTTTLSSNERKRLEIMKIHDRVLVYYNGVYLTTLQSESSTTLFLPKEPGELELLVESLGYIDNFSQYGLTDNCKGLLSLHIDNEYVHNFTIYTLPMNIIKYIGIDEIGIKTYGPTLSLYKFYIDEIADTYLNLKEFKKGIVYVNKVNIGKYWNEGAYCSLYVTKDLLQEGLNYIYIFDEYPTDEMRNVYSQTEHELC